MHSPSPPAWYLRLCIVLQDLTGLMGHSSPSLLRLLTILLAYGCWQVRQWSRPILRTRPTGQRSIPLARPRAMSHIRSA